MLAFNQVTPLLLSLSSCKLLSYVRPHLCLQLRKRQLSALLFPRSSADAFLLHHFAHTAPSTCKFVSLGCCQLQTPTDIAKPYLEITFYLKLFQTILLPLRQS